MSQPAIPSSELVGFEDDATEPDLLATRARSKATSQATSHPTSHATSHATSQAPPQGAAAGRTGHTPLGRARRRFVSAISSYRLRVLIWFIALLGLGTLATVVVMAEVLLQRTDARVQADLSQEADEFSRLAGGIDPATATPFGTDVERIFDVFLSRSIPSRNEVFVTFLDGEVYRRTGRGSDGSNYAIEMDPAYLSRVATVQASVIDRVSTPPPSTTRRSRSGSTDRRAASLRWPSSETWSAATRTRSSGRP